MSQHLIRCTTHGSELRVSAEASITQGLKSRGVVLHLGHACATMCFWLNAADARAIAHALTLAADEALLPLEEVTE